MNWFFKEFFQKNLEDYEKVRVPFGHGLRPMRCAAAGKHCGRYASTGLSPPICIKERFGKRRINRKTAFNNYLVLESLR